MKLGITEQIHLSEQMIKEVMVKLDCKSADRRSAYEQGLKRGFNEAIYRLKNKGFLETEQ